MRPEIAEHLAQVSAWLDENVVSYPTPAAITLSDIQMNWTDLSGSFILSLDGKEVPDRFVFSLDGTEWLKFFMPMFTSPLGAPASYAAVEFTEETRVAMEDGLRILMPKLAGFGQDRVTGDWVHQSTPWEARVMDTSAFEQARQRIEVGGYSITVPTKHI
ncbi:hypothetical protein [Polaromonas naphthalenivorans]|uniref:Uncharacterized protein n=1 Tax=Polaromonas naphthalenivorans (strain CJ2) TaxID=365044 RepID=A1VWC1_POLNA|nr:hypothetical protein [Polaromonas naphthalenivorans]ABM39949.1 hypothetical protein Pnap_4885 [Polaromonas naphthalenivorans CJ2]